MAGILAHRYRSVLMYSAILQYDASPRTRPFIGQLKIPYTWHSNVIVKVETFNGRCRRQADVLLGQNIVRHVGK